MGSVLEACVRLGIEANTDIAVLGFNDHSSGHQPLARSSYRLVQRSVEMGNMAAKRLVHRISNPEMLPQRICVMADCFPAEAYCPTAKAEEFRALPQKSNDRAF